MEGPLPEVTVASVSKFDEPLLGNAVERLLGKQRQAVINIVKETLEGNLRGVLATMTPEEVNSDKLRFASELKEEADHDMHKLGLELDTSWFASMRRSAPSRRRPSAT